MSTLNPPGEKSTVCAGQARRAALMRPAYIVALDWLIEAGLTNHELRVGRFLLKASFWIGNAKAVIADQRLIGRGARLAFSHANKALHSLLLRRIFFQEGSYRAKGTKLYSFNFKTLEWNLKQGAFELPIELPNVLEQVAFDFDDYVKESGPLADVLLDDFISNCAGAAVISPAVRRGENLCGGPQSPAVSERPCCDAGKGNEASDSPGASSDGQRDASSAAATQPVKHPSDGARLEKIPCSLQQKSDPAAHSVSRDPLSDSQRAWDWLVKVDNAQSVQKLSHSACAAQWQELCLRNPFYVLNHLKSTLQHRLQRGGLDHAISYLASVSKNEKNPNCRLRPWAEFSASQYAAWGGGYFEVNR